jgi:hypothetical protein
LSLSTVFEAVTGLSFLYAFLSLIASGTNELISSALALRARTLEKGVAHLLADPAEASAIYNHPLIQSLFRSRRRPSYIPPDKFALALLDRKVTPAVGAGADQATAISTAIQQLSAGRVKDTLDVLWRDAKHDADRFRRDIEGWFDDTMERVSGWYRRLVQAILFGIGAVMAVGLNVNTLTVAQRLWTDGPLRTAVVEQAQRAVPPAAADKQGVKDALDNVHSGLKGIGELSLPIGWDKEARPTSWYGAVAGWALTALAISWGAPFWFDLLGRVARVRSSGVRPEASVPPSAELAPHPRASLPL